MSRPLAIVALTAAGVRLGARLRRELAEARLCVPAAHLAVADGLAEPYRGRVVTLTPAGARLLVEVRGAWEKAQESARAELGHGPFAQLRKALPSPLARSRKRLG